MDLTRLHTALNEHEKRGRRTISLLEVQLPELEVAQKHAFDKSLQQKKSLLLFTVIQSPIVQNQTIIEHPQNHQNFLESLYDVLVLYLFYYQI